MIAGLERRRPLDKSEIDKNQYTLTLLRDAFRKGLITGNVLNEIRSGIMLLLKDMILRYNGGESTSIKTEAAERLLNSIYFTLDAYTYGIEDPMEALHILKKTSVEEVYKKGFETVAKCVDETKAMLGRISGERLEFGTEAYECLFDDLRDFFRDYDAVYAAHDASASSDYPVLFDDFAIRGVFYVRQYLEKLELETRFIKLYHPQDVIRLLRDHGRQNRIPYRKLMINMFELVLSHSAYSALSGGEVSNLLLTEMQCGMLEKRLTARGEDQIGKDVAAAFQCILERIADEQKDIASYALQYQPIFIKNLAASLKNGIFSRTVTTGGKGYTLNENIVLNQGKPLAEEEFHFIVSAVMRCDNMNDKKRIIRQSIRTRKDFIDILEADCLFEGEFDALYRSMEDIELAELCKALFNDGLRETSLDRILYGWKHDFSEDWQNRLVSYLNGLERERLDSISRVIDFMKDEAHV